MMSADMSSTLSPSMPVLTRISPDAPRIYARSKFYARPMPTLQMTAPSPTHTPAPEKKPDTVTRVQGARDDRAQSVIKLAVTVKSGLKTTVIAPEPKVVVVRVEDAVRLGRLESQSNGRYRMRQPTELQAPATHKQAHQPVEAAKMPVFADKPFDDKSFEAKLTSGPPKVASAMRSPPSDSGLNNDSEEADQGPPTLTMDDYFAKLSEEKGRMINKVFARIASVSSSHGDQQKNAVGVIRRPEYEDISDDEEDFARETVHSPTQHAVRNSPPISADRCAEPVAVNRRGNGAKGTLELLSVLEGTDYQLGGTEGTPRRQLLQRRTSAPGLVETTRPYSCVALQKVARSASLNCAGDGMEHAPRYPKMRISRCSKKSWKVIAKSPPMTSAATLSPPPASAERGGETLVTTDCPVTNGETRVIVSADKSAAVTVQTGAESEVNLPTTGAPSGDNTSLPRIFSTSVMSCAQGSVDATPVLASKPVSVPVINNPSFHGVLAPVAASSDAVRRLSEEKSIARPEVIVETNGVGVVKLAPVDCQIDLIQGEVETITGTEIPVLNDLGLGATKEIVRKRGRPPLQSLKKDTKVRSSTPPLPMAKKTIARKKSTSRRNFRHESIQTFKPTTAPPPWRYKGRAHVRSPDITLAPQRKLSVDLKPAETEIGPVSSPSPNELVIDLNPDSTETDVAGDLPEVVSVVGGQGSSPAEANLRRALSDPGNCGAVGTPTKGATAETSEKSDLSPSALDDDGPEGGKKRRKKDEGGDVVHAVQARLATKQHHEKGRRLAQELPGYNWLEEKILSGGVTHVLPPKIAPPAATCAGELPEVAIRLASIAENLVITKVQPTQPANIMTVVSAQTAPLDVQKQSVAEHGKPVEHMHTVERERHDSIARRTLIQLANGGDMQVTVERIPTENSVVANCDSNNKRRYEEAFVAKQLLHDFNAKNQLNQENRKRMEDLAAQQRNCAANLPPIKAPPSAWGGFAENVTTMARHTATSFDTGVGLTRGYPGPLPQEILPSGNSRIANGMPQGDNRMAPHRVVGIPPSSAHGAVNAVPTLSPGTPARVLVRSSSGEKTRSPQFPPEMYRIPQMVDAPLNAPREQNQKLTGETAAAHHVLFYEQNKLRGVHPRPAVPTATAAATARSSFPLLQDPTQTPSMLPIRHQEPLQPSTLHHQAPPTHQLPGNLVSPSHPQSHGNTKRDERNSQTSLSPQMLHGFKEQPFMVQNVGQIPPQFMSEAELTQIRTSMQVARSPEAYRDTRNEPGNVADLRKVPVDYAPTRFLQQTLLKPDGRSRPAQQTPQRKSQGGRAPNRRSPNEQAAVPSSVKDHINSQIYMTNNQYGQIPHMNPNLPPQALIQLRQQEAQKMAEQWRNKLERGRFAQAARAEATPVSGISSNAKPERFTSPQQQVTNPLGHASIYNGPLNHPFQLPPFSPPFTSVPGQTVYRAPVPPHQQSFKAPQHAHVDLVRPVNPQNVVPNYQQQIPYNFQPVCNMPAQYARNASNEYVESLKKRAARLELEQQELKRRHLVEISVMQKGEEVSKATQRHIARLETEKNMAFQKAFEAEEHLRLGEQQANLASRHEPIAIHAQVPWNNMIHHQMMHHQSRDQQTVSPRSIQQHQSGPLQRVKMSGGHVSPRHVQQQVSPQVAGAEVVHQQKYFAQDRQEMQQIKMQQHAYDQAAQVLQYPQMSPPSLLLIQKQNTQSPQQAQAQMNALSVQESQRQMREHEHLILQHQQTQRANNPPQQASPPNQIVTSQSATSSHRGSILRDHRRNKKQHSTEGSPTLLDKLVVNSDKDTSELNSEIAQSKKILHALLIEEAREQPSLTRNTVPSPTASQLQTPNKIKESGGPSDTIEIQSGTKQLTVRESVETLYHSSNILENEPATETYSKILQKNETCNKVHVDGLQGKLPKAAVGDSSSIIKRLPTLQPLPPPVKKMPELEKLLVRRGDLGSAVSGSSDLEPNAPASGETEKTPIDIVELDAAEDDVLQDEKYLPQAHQASFFSTATVKSGKKRFIQRSRYAVNNEPMDLSASKCNATDIEIPTPPLKIASSNIVDSLPSPISIEKPTETRAQSLPLQNLPESQPAITTNNIKDKPNTFKQKTPLQTKVAEEPESNGGNQLNATCSPDKSTQKIVKAPSNLEINIEKKYDILPTDLPNVGNTVVPLQSEDSACVGDASTNENPACGKIISNKQGFLLQGFPKNGGTDESQVATAELPAAQEPRTRSYSDTDEDEKMKAKFRTVKPLNSQEDRLQCIQEAKKNVESGSNAANVSEIKGTAAMSITNFNTPPYQQVRKTILQIEGVVSEPRNGVHQENANVPSNCNLPRNDIKKNIVATVTTKMGPSRNISYVQVTEQTSRRQFTHNEPHMQNVNKSGSCSEESECTIRIANIFSIKDVNPDGTYNERGYLSDIAGKKLMSDYDGLLMQKSATKTLTKQFSLPNPSTSPFTINNREQSVDDLQCSIATKKDINDNEDPALVQDTLRVDKTNACQKHKSSEDSEIACLDEGPTASKLLKPGGTQEVVVLETDKDYPNLAAADDSQLGEDLQMEDLPTSRNVTETNRTHPRPVVRGKPSPSYVVQPLCDVCGALATCSCSICQHVFYCSRDCQRSHWNVHGLHCKRWAAEWEP